MYRHGGANFYTLYVMKIGIVDLDTSHPQNWIPIEREMGHEIAGVWDGGDVHPPEYVREFAAKYDIPRVYSSLEAMASNIDCAIIHGCNWDTHVEKARLFVERGKAVLIDKPIAGNVGDLRKLRQWSREGARIAGGSSLRFSREIRHFLDVPVTERDTVHTAMTGCGVDEFNYGIHAYAMVLAIMGPGVASVRHLGDYGQRRVQITWNDGRVGFVIVGPTPKWMPFYVTIVTDRQAVHLQPDVATLYRPLLEAVLPYLAGQNESPPMSFDELMLPELCALAAKRSWSDRGREVQLSELDGSADVSYDGAAFASAYRRAKYPQENHADAAR